MPSFYVTTLHLLDFYKSLEYTDISVNISSESVANVLHCKNPLDVEDEWIDEYRLEEGNLDITDVDYDLVDRIPTALQIGKVYERLIHDTAMSNETEVEGIIRVYNDEICEKIDNYNCSAYYEPSYVIARAYYQGGF